MIVVVRIVQSQWINLLIFDGDWSILTTIYDYVYAIVESA